MTLHVGLQCFGLQSLSRSAHRPRKDPNSHKHFALSLFKASQTKVFLLISPICVIFLLFLIVPGLCTRWCNAIAPVGCPQLAHVNAGEPFAELGVSQYLYWCPGKGLSSSSAGLTRG